MASLKEIKGRIASIQNTQKITSAMRMVASAKLHHTQGMTEKFLHYKDEMQAIMERLGGFDTSLQTEGKVQSILLIPVSSNSGLCGAFNSNITKATLLHIQELEQQGMQVRLLPIGKKIAHDLQNKGFDCNIGYYNLIEKIEKNNSFSEVPFLIEFAQQLQQSGKIDRMEFIYHHFKSMGSQVITITPLHLDMPTPLVEEEAQRTDWLTEPTPKELLQALFPRLLNAQAYGILLDSLTSEHAARMLAMQTADDNANELLKELRLLYNKTRQQAITNELIDIMSGKSGQN
ncbi:MAG: ATP synthase F1 subunit gamma [Bacteroidaceae bacterium]|nr:ATP synthase F1 subunit gamma [Bacteroidaceae bacterium]